MVNIEEMVMQGLQLLLLGMGTVFIFLAILVYSVVMMSKLAAWIETRWPAQATEAAPRPQTAAAVPTSDATLMAVIAAAVHRYRIGR